MRTRVGLFRHPVEVLAADSQHSEMFQALVDTGALYSQLPSSALAALGYRPSASRRFRLADGGIYDAPIGDVNVRLRDEVHSVIFVFGVEGCEPLLGATTLETFTLAADPVQETLIPIIAPMMQLVPD